MVAHLNRRAKPNEYIGLTIERVDALRKYMNDRNIPRSTLMLSMEAFDMTPREVIDYAEQKGFVIKTENNFNSRVSYQGNYSSKKR